MKAPNHEEFLTAWHEFRDIMCSRDKSPEEKFEAWGVLLEVYILCESEIDEEEETRKSAMEMLMYEFPRRLGMEVALKLNKAFEALSDIDNEEVEGV